MLENNGFFGKNKFLSHVFDTTSHMFILIEKHNYACFQNKNCSCFT